MKTQTTGKFIALFIATLAFVAGCTKPDYPVPATSGEPFESSKVLLINALPDDSLLDFDIDNVVIANNIVTGSYAGTPYVPIYVGPRVVDAKFSTTTRSVGIGGSQTVVGAVFPFRTTSGAASVSLSASSSTLTGSALDAAVAALELTNAVIFPNSYYTVIAQGISGKRSKLILVDNITAPASGKAKIRLVNAAPGGVTSAILDTATGTAPIATVTGTVTGWTNIPTAAKAYNAAAATVQSFASVDASLNFAVYNGPAISIVSGVTTSATGIGSSFSVQSGGVYTLLVLKKNGAVTYSLIRHN